MVVESVITQKDDLLSHKDNIFELFNISFGKKIDIELWKWAYIKNIFGNPIVSLNYHDKKLVGHYAVIPFHLKLGDDSVKAVLSMTTMVHPEYRGRGFFTHQASSVYQSCIDLDIDLVFGFPNKNSAPGFERRLGWTIEKEFCVINTPYEQLDHLTTNSKTNNSKRITIDIDNEEFINWRLQKPGASYIRHKGLIKKPFKEQIDILYHERDFSSLDAGQSYNILAEKADHNESFAYSFGYRFFNDAMSGIDIDACLLMSDIF